MRLSGYQPQYFPRLHYFARILDSDIFEISDYVQFVKKHAYPGHGYDGKQKRGKSYQAHTVIKEHTGPQYLAVPTKSEGLQPINKTEIEYGARWHDKHLKTIVHSYSRARLFEPIYNDLSDILKKTYRSIAELNITTIFWAIARIVGEDTKKPTAITLEDVNMLLQTTHPFRLKQIVILSHTDIPPAEGSRDANDWIIDICKRYAVTEYYYGGTSASAYMDFERFRKAGITLIEQHWTCEPYTQQHNTLNFLPNLSIIDLLANVPIEEARNILTTRT